MIARKFLAERPEFERAAQAHFVAAAEEGRKYLRLGGVFIKISVASAKFI